MRALLRSATRMNQRAPGDKWQMELITVLTLTVEMQIARRERCSLLKALHIGGAASGAFSYQSAGGPASGRTHFLANYPR